MKEMTQSEGLDYAGLSTSAGLTYSGERFGKYFFDFIEKFGIRDMYSGGFYPFPDAETPLGMVGTPYLLIDPPKSVYQDLLKLIKGRDYFVITTNVDHQFQRAGFDKDRLFYVQGEDGISQVPKNCLISMRIPTELIPTCPDDGSAVTMNLPADDSFSKRTSITRLLMSPQYAITSLNIFLSAIIGHLLPRHRRCFL